MLCFCFLPLALIASIVIVLKYFLSIYVYRISILIIDFYCNNITLHIVTLYTRACSRFKLALQLAPQSLTTLTCQPIRLRMCVCIIIGSKWTKFSIFLFLLQYVSFSSALTLLHCFCLCFCLLLYAICIVVCVSLCKSALFFTLFGLTYCLLALLNFIYCFFCCVFFPFSLCFS